MLKKIVGFKITFVHFRTGQVTEISSGNFEKPMENLESEEWQAFTKEVIPLFYDADKVYFTGEYTTVIKNMDEKEGCFKIYPYWA